MILQEFYHLQINRIVDIAHIGETGLAGMRRHSNILNLATRNLPCAAPNMLVNKALCCTVSHSFT